jgi:hypothetical protein
MKESLRKYIWFQAQVVSEGSISEEPQVFRLTNGHPVAYPSPIQKPRPERHLSKSGKEVSPMPDEEIERLRLALTHLHDERPSFGTRFVQAVKDRLNPKKQIVVRVDIEKKKNVA